MQCSVSPKFAIKIRFLYCGLNHIGEKSTPIESWIWDLQFTSMEREDEPTLHEWIADLLLRTELGVIAKRGDRT